MSAKVIQVIEVVTHRGKGTHENPCRIVLQYYSFDGKFLAERDAFQELNQPRGLSASEQPASCEAVKTPTPSEDIP